MSIDDSLHGLQGRYIRAPQWVKTLVGGLYAKIPPEVRFGRVYRDYQRVFADDASAASFGAARLAVALRSALQTVPAYARFQHLLNGLDASSAPQVLAQLPLVDKEAIKLDLASFCSTAYGPADRLPMFTGGSTSVPMSFYLHKGVSRAREWAAFRDMALKYQTDGDGVVLALRGRNVSGAATDDGQIWAYDPIKRHLIVSTDHLEERHMRRYVDALRARPPRYVHAYPSALFPLITWLKDQGMQDLLSQVKGVLLTSESVFEHHLAAFKAFFACPVIVHYGHSERVLFAHTLPDDTRYHFWPHYGHLELVDPQGRPVTQAGQVGELVGTGFDNDVMPFIRYRTGDYGVLGQGPCPGLPGFPVVERIEGRLQEFVVCHDERLVTVATLGAAHFEELNQCLRIQYEQREPGQLILRVVPLRPMSAESCRRIERAVFDKTQGGCRVTVQEVASIEVTARGKQRLLVQHLPLQRYLGAAMQNRPTP